jgi:tryptophanyl-tRNA synthetase
MPEVIANLFTIMDIVSTPDTVKFFKDKYASCEIRYGDLKKQLAEDVVKLIAPINVRIKDIDSDSEYLSKVAKLGAEKARESAAKTLKEVREIIGFRRFW